MPADNGRALSLLKGTLRAVTGSIVRSNGEGYRIVTPTATIGVRGTAHEPAYYPPAAPGKRIDHEPGTYDKVNDGASCIRNPRGEVDIKPGQQAFVHHNRRVSPRLLSRAPAFYRRHAEIDRRAEAHRAEFHRVFEERHQKRLQEIRQRLAAPANGLHEKAAGRDALKANASAEKSEPAKAPQAGHATEQKTRQEQRREAAEKRQQERQAAQEQRKHQQADDRKKREAERTAHQERKKEHHKAAEHHDDKHHPR